MDRPIPAGERRNRKRRQLAVLLALMLFFMVLFLLIPRLLSPRLARADLRFARVLRGPMEATLGASGLVKPEFEDQLSSPADTRIRRVLAKPGQILAQGDTIMQLDTEKIEAQLRRITDGIALKKAQLRKSRAEQSRNREDLENQLAVLAERIRYLEAKRRQEQDLYDRRLTTVWSLRQAERDENIARLEHKGLQDRIARLQEGASADEEATRIEMRLLQQDHDLAQQERAASTLLATRECVLSWSLEQEGQMVSRGTPLARLANRDSWKIEGELSDAHTSRLLPGQRIRVHLNERLLGGTVERIHPTIDSGRMHFDIRLDTPRDPALRSNQRVDLELVLEERTNTLLLERGPGIGNRSTKIEIFVLVDDRLQRRELRCGLSNRTHIEILEGLQEGDEVVISNMGKWMHLESVGIN